MRRLALIIAVGLVLPSCLGELGPTGEPEVTRSAVLSWSLETDGDGALVDPAHPEYGIYPNPRSVEGLEILVFEDGRICADAGLETFCGGLVHGIPYSTRGRESDGEVVITVVDMYGNDVAEYVAEDEGAMAALSDQEACRDTVAPSGAPCTVCTDADGSVTSNSCTVPSDQTPNGNAALIAAQVFVDTFNEYLDQAGIDAELPMPELWQLSDFDEGDISIGSPACSDVLEYLDDEFDDDHEGTDDWVFGEDAMQECLEDGDCRIGQLVTRAMAAACTQIPEGASLRKASMGVIGAGGFAIESCCPGDNQMVPFMLVDSCVGSPLVVDVAGDGLDLSGLDAAVTFDLLDEGLLFTGWLGGSDDALLAVDLDGDGQITSGRELLGEASVGRPRDGFAALARFDANDDGVVDDLDPAYEKLLAWVDDGDARSQSWELFSLPALGIAQIPVTGSDLGASHPSGNELGLAADAIMADGTTRPVVDVWFTLAGSPL